MQDFARRLVGSSRFQHFITGVILFAAVLVGLETNSELMAHHGATLHALDKLILAIFTAEIALKMLAEAPAVHRYFREPWNVFDFLIVASALLPFDAEYLTVLRLLRLLRVLRLIHALPRLQIIVGALLKSIPSMGYVSLLLFLVFYVYGVAAVFLFGQNDPFRFGSLSLALVTLFTVATGEDWSTTLYTQMYGCTSHGYDGRQELCTAPSAHPVLAPIFFISFILLGTMIILNLFIGVIMKGMEEAELEQDELLQRRREAQGEGHITTVAEDLRALETKLDELRLGLSALAHKASAASEARRPPAE
jgi:voltage-gated sodium channel